uniref:Uncharacterized protein n=1 Tax=Anopheles coluzzii TaxID=1518534 RepID=A0A8W7PYB5_ANOCL
MHQHDKHDALAHSAKNQLRRNRGTVSEDLNTSKINPFYAASIPTGLAEPAGSGQQPLNHTAFVVVLLVAVGKMADFFYQNFSAFVSRFDSLPAGSAMSLVRCISFFATASV